LCAFLFLFLVSCASPFGAGSSAPTGQAATSGGTVVATHTPLPPLKQRQLQLPTVQPGNSCPVTSAKTNVSPDYKAAYGSGPAYVVSGTTNGMSLYSAPPFNGDTNDWGGMRETWEIAHSYTGTVLIRGRQIDGANPVQFNGGVTEVPTNATGTEPMLETLTLKGGQPGQGWSTWVTYTRLKSPGCYAYQVDGTNFSYVVVFAAKAL
jgi:hypothetical protein